MPTENKILVRLLYLLIQSYTDLLRLNLIFFCFYGLQTGEILDALRETRSEIQELRSELKSQKIISRGIYFHVQIITRLIVCHIRGPR